MHIHMCASQPFLKAFHMLHTCSLTVDHPVSGVVEALILCVPDIFAAVKTGHDLTSVSAMYDYMGAGLVLTIPGAVPLAGWPPVPWGQLGPGAQPACLDALSECGVHLPQLLLVMEEVFNLNDCSPPGFLEGGQMRGAVECAFATLLMYYEERFDAGEMHKVQVRV